MHTYIKSKIRTFLVVYRVFLFISIILTAIFLISKKLIFSITTIFSLFSSLGALLFTHVISKRYYIFYQNQGFSIKKLYTYCWLLNLFFVTIANIIVSIL